MTSLAQETDPGAEWRSLKQLHSLYNGVAREFAIEAPACAELEAEATPSEEALKNAKSWLLDMDQRIGVFQLRQFLQNTTLPSKESLEALVKHHLAKTSRGESDRDKIDFLLVQFFSTSVPSRIENREITLKYVAEALEPVLGAVDPKLPEPLEALEDLIDTAKSCSSLNKLFNSGILEKGRKQKSSAGDNYFQPAWLVAFTRFNFMLRRVFFRLMHQDLNTILEGLRELEQRGVTTLDCRKAQFSGEEPVERLRIICQSWKVMFQAEYSSGQPLRMLVDLRAAVDAARTPASSNSGGKKKKSQSRAKGAAAGASGGSDVPEFEVSAPKDQPPDDPTS